MKFSDVAANNLITNLHEAARFAATLKDSDLVEGWAMTFRVEIVGDRACGVAETRCDFCSKCEVKRGFETPLADLMAISHNSLLGSLKSAEDSAGIWAEFHQRECERTKG